MSNKYVSVFSIMFYRIFTVFIFLNQVLYDETDITKNTKKYPENIINAFPLKLCFKLLF